MFHFGSLIRLVREGRSSFADVSRSPAILEICALLRELILRVTEWPSDQALTPAQHRLVATLLDELASADSAPLHLPMPQETRLLTLAQALLDDPALPEGASTRMLIYAATLIAHGMDALAACRIGIIQPLGDDADLCAALMATASGVFG